jgi:hypothetical protein
MDKIRIRAGEPLNREVVCDVSVTTRGMFTTTLHPAEADVFREYGIILNGNRLGRSGYFESDTYDGLKKAVAEKIQFLCSRKLESESLVLRYQLVIACSYAVTFDGRFAPHCNEKITGYWREGNKTINATHRSPFGLQVWAKPFIKKTYSFLNGKISVEYVSYERKDRFDLSATFEDPLEFLAAIPVICQVSSEKIEEIPATKENCEFFAGIIKGIFALNEKIKEFMTPEGIQALAAKGGRLLGS